MDAGTADAAATTATSGRRVAIVHEKFTVYAGSERVVDEMHRMWPDAPIFTSVCDPATVGPVLAGADIRPVRWLAPLYRGGDHYAHLLPLLPLAHRAHDLSGFDLVVTSHHAFANLATRARVAPGTPIVSYTHTPARWMWDASMRADEVGGALGRGTLAAFAATRRGPDRRAAARLRGVVANSREVARRVERWWHREATVVAPPVDVEHFRPDVSVSRGDFFLLAGRLVPYKRPEIAVAAARRAGVRLVVAGEGRSRRACEAVAGPGIEFVGTADDATLLRLYRECRALVYPGLEDFGIMLVEAQACGTPVIALGAGAALETVVDGVTGVHYQPAATVDAVGVLAAALRTFDESRFDRGRITAHAQHYGPERFRHELAATIGAMLDR